jgi:hypothetical protein
MPFLEALYRGRGESAQGQFAEHECFAKNGAVIAEEE